MEREDGELFAGCKCVGRAATTFIMNRIGRSHSHLLDAIANKRERAQLCATAKRIEIAITQTAHVVFVKSNIGECRHARKRDAFGASNSIVMEEDAFKTSKTVQSHLQAVSSRQ